MVITAAQVKELRERTGVSMMECKKALQAVQGNIEQAIEEMRKSGVAKAIKKAGRVAVEGVVLVVCVGHDAAMVEVNCETDFVAYDASFLVFANTAVQQVLALRTNNVQALLASSVNAATIDQARIELITKVGENINVRRCEFMTATSIGTYLHTNRIGVIVQLQGGDAELAHDVAMHIAASKPVVVQPDDVNAATVHAEKMIFTAQAAESGKPANILEKIVEGRVKKFLESISLSTQTFIKNPELTVGDLLKQHKACVNRFVRYELGESIEVVAGCPTAAMAAAQGTN